MPDLVVLDWMLPGVSGIELCRRLRTRPETGQLPILMLTARGEEDERIRGLAPERTIMSSSRSLSPS
jgi:two-component system phosphate regulon response regulator PhoB